jgi:2-amino-4-hydroxy-6-hydroxymethyldihydropteridine diphosphokinase
MISNSSQATVFLSLGSNIEPEKNLARAVQLLRTKCEILKVSQAYRTPAQGDTEQDNFLNLALKMTTVLTPITLKHAVVDWIERELGRIRDPGNKNAPRTIDLDISLWNDEVFEYGEKPWRVPDPDIMRFAHVVVPLAEIAPDYIHPIEKVTLAEIAARFESSLFQRGRLSFNE